MRRITIALILLAFVAIGSALHAEAAGQTRTSGTGLWHDSNAGRVIVPKPPTRTNESPAREAITIEHVTLEPAAPIGGAPAVRVTFEIYNRGVDELTDIVLTISLLTPPQRTGQEAEPSLIAGPLIIRSKVVLQPGYSFAYDITLRNVSVDCSCVPAVDVVDARRVTSSTQRPSPTARSRIPRKIRRRMIGFLSPVPADSAP